MWIFIILYLLFLVLLIALSTLGSILFILLLVCIIMTCARRRPQAAGMSFLPQRVGNRRSTLDRRVMIQDTSSEDSRSETGSLPVEKVCLYKYLILVAKEVLCFRNR